MLKLFFDFFQSLYTLVYEPITISDKTLTQRVNRVPLGNSEKARITRLRVRPVVILLTLVFLFCINSIIIFSYEIGHEHKQVHTNVLVYMYVYFWLTFFLIAYQIIQISRSEGRASK